jgi:hypothetical protein
MLAQGSIGAPIMDVIALIVFIGSIYFAGLIAKRRGRSFRNWAWIAAFTGPLAFPLIFLFPNLHGRDPQDRNLDPNGEKRPADLTGAVKPVVQDDSDPSQRSTSFAGGTA